MRSLAIQESSGVAVKIAAVVGAVLVLAAIGLAIYGGAVSPVRQSVEKVLPDSRFAH